MIPLTDTTPQRGRCENECSPASPAPTKREERRPRTPKERTLRGIPLLILVLSVLPGTARAQDRVVYSVAAGECWLSFEANETWASLRLRVRPESSDCHVEKETMLAALKAALSNTDPSHLSGTHASLSIGRLIDYPWVSQHLATTAYRDPAWDAKRGKPKGGDINAYVATILAREPITAPINETLAHRGYRVRSVTVEKVLVGGFRDVPLYQGKAVPGKVPFDAQVWFRLQKP